MVGEVQIVSNNFGAEYGRNSGTIVNYVTKSGSNAFHGSGFEYNTGNWSFSHQNGQKNPLLGFCTTGQDPLTTGCLVPEDSALRGEPLRWHFRWPGHQGQSVVLRQLPE